jgi:hypothetical protein
MSAARLGKSPSEETKAKMRAAKIGSTNMPSTQVTILDIETNITTTHQSSVKQLNFYLAVLLLSQTIILLKNYTKAVS